MMSIPTFAFSRSQTVASQTRSDATEECVEDSEPERESRRAFAKSRRGKKPRAMTPADLIELTDSDAPSHTPSRTISRRDGAETVVIIDISDGSEFSSLDELIDKDDQDRCATPFTADERSISLSGDESSLPSIGDILGLPKTGTFAQPSVAHTSVAAPKRASLPLPTRAVLPDPLSQQTTAEESDDEERSGGSLKLAKFAYTAPTSQRRTASKTPSSSEYGTPVPESQLSVAKPKRMAITSSHSFAADFADAELSRLRKCVSCEQAWTVRKTVTNKMKHIQTCAKKRKLTDDTVRKLLRDELSKLPPVASTSKVDTPPPADPETLLEDRLNDAQKKKARCRLPVFQTVKSVEETRDSILDRARLLLQDTRNTAHNQRTLQVPPKPAVSTDFQMPPPLPATQDFGRGTLAAAQQTLQQDHPAADTTLVFGPSRFAQAARSEAGIVRTGADIAAHSDVSPLTQVFNPSIPGSARSAVTGRDVDVDEAPPSTQLFGQSKFANARTIARKAFTENDDPISIHDSSEDERERSSPVRPTCIPSSPSSNANALQHSPSPRQPAEGAFPTDESQPHSLLPLRSPPPGGDGLQCGNADMGATDEREDEDDSFHNWNACNEGAWSDDDGGAYLHYDPETDRGAAGPTGPPAAIATHLTSRTMAAIAEQSQPLPGPSRANIVAEPPKKKGRRKKAAVESDGDVGTKKTRRKRAVEPDDDAGTQTALGKDISQEELNARLREAILKDEMLHLRVLRYEPVHFDVFMKLATDMGIPAKRSGLKNKVRAFLDQMAIHFHDVDPSKSRNRRRARYA